MDYSSGFRRNNCNIQLVCNPEKNLIKSKFVEMIFLKK